jgi:acyl-CoA synthetase (AMP-forming)/AMP-acid ligase II
VARRLAAQAAQLGSRIAIAVPKNSKRRGKRLYSTVSFEELEADSNQIASALADWGVEPGMRIALLVPPSAEFISLVFALFKAGAVIVLIDPGMGRRNLLRCLAEAEPEGMIAIPLAQVVRVLFRRKFPLARFNVTVGKRRIGGAIALAELRRRGSSAEFCFPATAQDPAAVIFTTGSTGPPKGVLYRHGNFDQQVTELANFYGIRPGEVDLPGFPLFGLFNCALGVTTVIPQMNASRPARVDPRLFTEAIRDWNVTQSFGSPAIWNRVGQYCQKHNVRLPSLGRVLSAGAPVPPHVLARMKGAIATDGDIHTPYGATEALPVASISASEVLSETQYAWAQGGGTCVGRRFPGIRWKVIRIVDGPIGSIEKMLELPAQEIGELIVSGPVVTSEYVTRVENNALAKIQDGPNFWHRMGDAGYFDAQDRFWFCGRVAHRVQTGCGVLYTEPCEGIFNQHPAIFRSALVGVGPANRQRPVLIGEAWTERRPRSRAARQKLLGELGEIAAGHQLTAGIRHFMLHRSLPVDIRHNAKIFREQLAVWAARRLR